MEQDGAGLLEGGCRVRPLRSARPWRTEGLTVWPLFGRDTGATAISLRALELSSGFSSGWRDRSCDEVGYVLSGAGTLHLDGWPFPLAPDTAFHVARGVSFGVEVARPAPLVILSAQCPEPASPAPLERAILHPAANTTPPAPAPVVCLADREALPSGDRWYRLMADREIGCHEVTQFVGSIPPGRSPDHFHHYEEVLVILLGTGRMWAGDTCAPLEAGSCVYLPRGQRHCVENTGAGELRLMGVFYPAGSPAVRYDTGASQE